MGIGIGMFTSAKPIELKKSLLPLTFIVFLMAVPFTRVLLSHTSELLSSSRDFVIWYGMPTLDLSLKAGFILLGLILTYLVLILIVDIFVQIGRILGRLMNSEMNPIWVYSVNIFGSIVGTLLFVLLSFYYQPPFTWFLLSGILIAFFIHWTNKDNKVNFLLLGIIIILSWFAGQTPGAIEEVWSPYQKLVVRESEGNDIGQYVINVNNVGYQGIVDLSGNFISNNSEKFPPKLKGLSQYDIPFLFHPNPKSVLLVGAGAGNDASGALRHNVSSVTAVEIDPAIIALGNKYHPEKPYSSPNVKIVNDDARSFFTTTSEKYDVISFGLLDSHTTTSFTNARLDHYVYTKESISQAKSKLSEGGIMVLTFEAQRSFIVNRIQRVLKEEFHEEPLVFRIPGNSYGWGGVMFVVGDMQNIKNQLRQNEQLSNYIQELQKTYPITISNDTKVITDDWPYFYLESARIPLLYYLLIGLMIIVFVRSNKKWESNINFYQSNRSFWHFVFLGAAFLLLEVQNISKASVVLGNTWQVNAVIITSVLAMSLLANLIAHKFPRLPIAIIYILLVLTCLTLYFVDLARFGFLPYHLKAIVVGTLTSLPMLFSGIVFVRSFAIAKDKSEALGANLIGAIVGALLQSITFIIGVKALLLIVAAFYILSLLTRPSLANTK